MLSDWSIVSVIFAVLFPLSLVCVIVASCVAVCNVPPRCVVLARTSAELLPFLLDCLMVHLLLVVPSLLKVGVQVASFGGGGSTTLKTLDWTIRHSLSAGNVASSAGKQSKMFAPGDVDVDICTTMLAVVQFHPSPGQFGPA